MIRATPIQEKVFKNPGRFRVVTLSYDDTEQLEKEMKQYKIEKLNSVYPEEGLTEKQSTQQEQALIAINRLYNEGNLNLCCYL